MCSPPCRLMLLLCALERSHWGEFQFQIQCITLGNQRPPPPTTTGHAYKVLYSIKVKWHGSAQVEVVEEEDGWAAKKGVSSYRDCRIKARPHFILHSPSQYANQSNFMEIALPFQFHLIPCPPSVCLWE